MMPMRRPRVAGPDARAALQVQPDSFQPFPWLTLPPLAVSLAHPRFAEILIEAGVVTTTRKTRGDDIDAACGQLAGLVLDRTQRTGRRSFPLQLAVQEAVS
jgi:hypothetical protein